MRYLKKVGILLLTPLAVACAGAGDKTDAVDWSKSSIYKVKTKNGDRVTARVVGSAADGYNYFAHIKHMMRPNSDIPGRQRVLDDASKIFMSRLCGAKFKEERPIYVSNYYGRRARFICTKE